MRLQNHREYSGLMTLVDHSQYVYDLHFQTVSTSSLMVISGIVNLLLNEYLHKVL
jgi:hypothetical protein